MSRPALCSLLNSPRPVLKTAPLRFHEGAWFLLELLWDLPTGLLRRGEFSFAACCTAQPVLRSIGASELKF
eukprot:scaffold75640_cov69-Phaeocystis_antarctica.AAC.3